MFSTQQWKDLNCTGLLHNKGNDLKIMTNSYNLHNFVTIPPFNNKAILKCIYDYYITERMMNKL